MNLTYESPRRYSFELPSPRPGSTPRKPVVAGRDVLVIEDHPVARRALELSLGHLGHLVFSAPSLRDAAELLRGLQIDVVVCDYHLPDGKAPDLLAHWPAGVRRVPSICISGLPDPRVHPACLAAGFDAFLAKPLAVDALQRTIRDLTSHKD